MLEKDAASKYYKLDHYERPEGEFNLFSPSGNRQHEVMLGGEDNDWYSYCTGYWRAADALVGYLIQEDLPTRRDYSQYWESIGYSILFLYRHYFELRIKQLFISCGGKLKKVDTDHSLLRLWGLFRDQYHEFCADNSLAREDFTEESLKDVATLENIISQMDNIDKNSQIFRYPFTKDEKVSLVPIQTDMVRLRNALGWAAQYLDGWSAGIYEEWQNEIRSRYEARIQDQVYVDEQGPSCETVEIDCEVEDGFR